MYYVTLRRSFIFLFSFLFSIFFSFLFFYFSFFFFFFFFFYFFIFFFIFFLFHLYFSFFFSFFFFFALFCFILFVIHRLKVISVVLQLACSLWCTNPSYVFLLTHTFIDVFHLYIIVEKLGSHSMTLLTLILMKDQT